MRSTFNGADRTRNALDPRPARHYDLMMVLTDHDHILPLGSAVGNPRFRNAFKEARKAWNVDEGYALDAYRGRTYDLGHYILNAIYEFMDDEYGPKKLKHNFGKRMQEWLDAAAKRIEDEDKEVLHMKWWGRY